MVLALVGAVLTLAVSPASAQSIQVVTFENVEPDTDDVSWQTRVTVVSLGGCTPEQGLGAEGYVSGWLREDSQGGGPSQRRGVLLRDHRPSPPQYQRGMQCRSRVGR